DHLNLDNTMTGVTDLVAIVGINAGGEEQDFTDNEAYVFADGASAVAGGTATDIITDYTNLTQVGAFISDALTIGESNGNATDCDTLTGDEALFVVNDLVADLTYVYHFKEDGTATDASAEDVVSSGELTIIGVVSEESDAALVAADIV
ncbi:MAG: hypothetical protein U9P72_06270, partial [Campylobacterota bacterium]|nr:hypothetical protein [Campylobacterota bacterium]